MRTHSLRIVVIWVVLSGEPFHVEVADMVNVVQECCIRFVCHFVSLVALMFGDWCMQLFQQHISECCIRLVCHFVSIMSLMFGNWCMQLFQQHIACQRASLEIVVASVSGNLPNCTFCTFQILQIFWNFDIIGSGLYPANVVICKCIHKIWANVHYVCFCRWILLLLPQNFYS